MGLEGTFQSSVESEVGVMASLDQVGLTPEEDPPGGLGKVFQEVLEVEESREAMGLDLLESMLMRCSSLIVLTLNGRATLPGVMFGSSSMFLELRPCHGFPGTNSGIISLMLNVEVVFDDTLERDSRVKSFPSDWLILKVMALEVGQS